MERKAAPLFRHVAIEAASGTQIGEPLATYWRGITLFTLTAFALLGALLVFSATVEYSPIHRVPSYIDVLGGLVRLGAPVNGIVKTLAVEEGAAVHAGDLLAVLNSDRMRADGGSWHAALRQKLNDERGMLTREIDAAKQEALANHAMIDRKIAGLRTERAALLADIRSGEQRLDSLRSQSEQIASLAAKGYATSLYAAQKHDEVMAQQSRLAASRAALARVEREIETSIAEQRLVDTRLSGLIANRHRSNGELERLIVQSDADAEQVIRAPEDGTVSSALIAKGQSVVAGQALFTIAPGGNPLIVRLVVPARAAASVRPGMEIKLVFRAYPQEKFGEFAARIETVSENPSMPADLPQVYAIAEPAFIATASLPAELRARDGQAIRVKPGMLADALVPIERRTVIEWLFEPILRGFNESAGRPRPTAAAAQGAR